MGYLFYQAMKFDFFLQTKEWEDTTLVIYFIYGNVNSTQYSIMAYMGKESKNEWISVCMYVHIHTHTHISVTA